MVTLFIFGLVLVLVSLFGLHGNEALVRLRRPVFVIGLGLAILGGLASTVEQIDPGQIGVKVFFGSVQKDVLREGLNFINPFTDVKKITIQTQNYTMSATHSEGTKEGDDAVRALSMDGLEIVIDLTILYRVLPNEAPRILRETGLDYEDKIIRSLARTRIRENAAQFNAIDLFSKRRKEFEAVVSSSIEKDFHERGFILQNLLVRNIGLPQSVKESIERKITAEQESQRMQYVLEKGRQEAELKRVEAQGTADAQRILSEALSEKVLQYETIKMQKELATSPNSKIIVLGAGKSIPSIMMTDK